MQGPSRQVSHLISGAAARQSERNFVCLSGCGIFGDKDAQTVELLWVFGQGKLTLAC
jgi:hypothetical protein